MWTQSHSRPQVSDDNPFSEAQFKTLKYRPDFPERFGSIQDAKAFCRGFFHWYNHVHYHSGLSWLTPAMVHYGQTGPVLQRRQQALDRAHQQHPERFVNGPRQDRRTAGQGVDQSACRGKGSSLISGTQLSQIY